MADATPLIYIGGSLCALGLYFGCLRLLDDLFPRGIRFFDPIELEEIKIERLDDVENSLKSSMQSLKDKMSFNRQKKTALLADRDLRVVLDENVQANNNGRNIYGEAWEATYKGKSVPVKAVVPPVIKPERPMIQKENVSEEEEEVEVEDEKIDLWQMWNHIREDGKKVDMRDSYNKGKKKPVAIVNDENDYNYSDTTRLLANTRSETDGLIKDNSSHPVRSHTHTTTQHSVQYYSSKNLPAPLLKNNLNIGTPKRQELHSLSIHHTITATTNNNGKSDSFSTPRGQIGTDKSVKSETSMMISKAPSHIKPPAGKPPPSTVQYLPLGASQSPGKVTSGPPTMALGMAGSLPIRKPPPPMGPPPGFRKSSSDSDNSKNKNI